MDLKGIVYTEWQPQRNDKYPKRGQLGALLNDHGYLLIPRTYFSQMFNMTSLFTHDVIDDELWCNVIDVRVLQHCSRIDGVCQVLNINRYKLAAMLRHRYDVTPQKINCQVIVTYLQNISVCDTCPIDGYRN